MKRMWITTLIGLTALILVGCNREEALDKEMIEEIFDRLVVDTNAVMANRILYEENASIDEMEMYDATNRDAIVFHFITTSDNVLDRRDEMILITPDFIYRTKTMKRYAHAFNPHHDDDFKLLVKEYCTIIDLDDLSVSHLKNVALSLREPKRFPAHGNDVLRGLDETKETPDDMVDVVEFEYANDRLLELRLRREYDRPSTKQQSNFVAGTHYYFMSSLFEDFPDLDQFTDA